MMISLNFYLRNSAIEPRVKLPAYHLLFALFLFIYSYEGQCGKLEYLGFVAW